MPVYSCTLRFQPFYNNRHEFQPGQILPLLLLLLHLRILRATESSKHVLFFIVGKEFFSPFFPCHTTAEGIHNTHTHTSTYARIANS